MQRLGISMNTYILIVCLYARSLLSSCSSDFCCNANVHTYTNTCTHTEAHIKASVEGKVLKRSGHYIAVVVVGFSFILLQLGRFNATSRCTKLNNLLSHLYRQL